MKHPATHTTLAHAGTHAGTHAVTTGSPATALPEHHLTSGELIYATVRALLPCALAAVLVLVLYQ